MDRDDKVDRCLILAAGLGTRMGEIGQVLPKVIWPFFEVTILKVIIDYVRDILGAQHIYINLHYKSELLAQTLEHENVTLLFEPELLNIGGAIHRLASRPEVAYKGNLLVIGADQFFFFKHPQLLQQGLKALRDATAYLYANNYQASEKYNHMVLVSEKGSDGNDQQVLKEIVGPLPQGGVTYSVVGLIKLADLTPDLRPQSFFETVANYKKHRVLVRPCVLGLEVDYYDFGTADRYYKSIYHFFNKLIDHLENLKPGTDNLLSFCLLKKYFKLSKILSATRSYNTSSFKGLNFSSRVGDEAYPEAVILRHAQQLAPYQGPGIYFEQLFWKA